MRYLLPLLAAALSSATARAEQLDVDLKDGERLYGTLVSISADDVVLKRSMWSGRHGVIIASQVISRATILAMRPVTSLEDDFRTRAAESSDSYASQYALARWCLDRGLTQHAADIALKLASEDRDDGVTAELLVSIGYLRVGGAWVERDAYARAHHLVDYGGALMSPEEAAARTDYSNAELQIREAQERIAGLEASTRATLLELRDETVALKRAERHQRQERSDAEQARLKTLTPDQIADEQEALAFDREHGIAEANAPDDKEVQDARKSAILAQSHYDQALSDLSVAKAVLAKAQAESADAAQRVSSLSGVPFLPGGTPPASVPPAAR